MTNVNPSQTPNVVIEDPAVRKGLRFVLDLIGAVTVIAGAVDLASEVLDFANITTPVLAGYSIARVVFGFAVDAPNTPTK